MVDGDLDQCGVWFIECYVDVGGRKLMFMLVLVFCVMMFVRVGLIYDGN